ncbi:MAG: hypothetical protein QXX95_00685 [Nitrososphaerales archaeon]
MSSIIKPIWIGETAGPDLRYWDPDFDKDQDDDSQDFPANEGERERSSAKNNYGFIFW